MLALRPHHLLCTYCFAGNGYSPAFIKNYWEIINKLPATQIKIVNHTDAICDPCPHKQNLICHTEAKVQNLDAAHAQALQICAGDVISWEEAKTKIKNNITLEVFHHICSGCEWKELKICQGVLALADSGV